MGITIDGINKLIILDTLTTFVVKDIYIACENWEALSGNMQYLEPMESAGNFDMGGGIFSDTIFSLANGFHLQPSGYVAGTQINLTGTLITSDGSNLAVEPTVGSPVSWFIRAATAGTIAVVASGSGLSTDEHNKLMALPSSIDNANQLYSDAASVPLPVNVKEVNGEAIVGDGSTSNKFRSHLV